MGRESTVKGPDPSQTRLDLDLEGSRAFLNREGVGRKCWVGWGKTVRKTRGGAGPVGVGESTVHFVCTEHGRVLAQVRV